MSGIKCFLIEPVFGNALLGEKYDCWNTENREILRWRRTDTGEEREQLHKFGPGAMWFAIWMPKNFYWENMQGPPLCVETPGGTWDIDSRCSNCTMKNDHQHRCWVRHGEAPMVTVDKNGITCGAGAGSIQCGSYHGYLRNGFLVQA